MNQSDMWAKLKIFTMQKARRVTHVVDIKEEWDVVLGATFFFCDLTSRVGLDEKEGVVREVEKWYLAGLQKEFTLVCTEWFKRAKALSDEEKRVMYAAEDMLGIMNNRGGDHASRN